jgi:hypothetical protein
VRYITLLAGRGGPAMAVGAAVWQGLAGEGCGLLGLIGTQGMVYRVCLDTRSVCCLVVLSGSAVSRLVVTASLTACDTPAAVEWLPHSLANAAHQSKGARSLPCGACHVVDTHPACVLVRCAWTKSAIALGTS